MRKTPHLTLLIFISFLLATTSVCAQRATIGLSLGASSFFGDLGGANNYGRPLYHDFNASLVKPAATITYLFSPNSRFAFRGSFTITQIAGRDNLLDSTPVFSPSWFRWYRNLSFRSNLVELSLITELNILDYRPGSIRYIKKERWTPYVFGGIGIFHFNPQAYYNGDWVDLQPLHTEGEGFPQYPDRKEYKLNQVCIPLGAGIKYNVSEEWTLGFEIGDRITFTDYLDDVSRKYVSQDDFNSYFANDPAKAALAYALSVRSGENDPEGNYNYITAPGQQRGNKSNRDQYITAQITMAYVFPLNGPHYWWRFYYNQLHR